MVMKSVDTIAVVLLVACLLIDNHHIDAFTTAANPLELRAPLLSPPSVPSPSSLSMARFDRSANRWIAQGPSDEPSAGYGLVGSLIRAGPLPFFRRVTDPDQYEQAVLKYMATDGCDRMEAQGNMVSFSLNELS